MVRKLIDDRMLTNMADFFPSTCTVQERTDTQDEFGQPIPAWIDLHTDIDCRLSPYRGDEIKKPDQTYATDVHIITLNDYYNDITVLMRAIVNSINYDILLVEHDGQNRLTKLTVERTH
jgi:head-tail adaptor